MISDSYVNSFTINGWIVFTGIGLGIEMFYF